MVRPGSAVSCRFSKFIGVACQYTLQQYLLRACEQRLAEVRAPVAVRRLGTSTT